jgi:hypothetical protein
MGDVPARPRDAMRRGVVLIDTTHFALVQQKVSPGVPVLVARAENTPFELAQVMLPKKATLL